MTVNILQIMSGTSSIVINMMPNKKQTEFMGSNDSHIVPADWTLDEGTVHFPPSEPGLRILVYDLVYEIVQERSNELKELAKY